MKTYNTLYSPEDNYFYYQILNNRYSPEINIKSDKKKKDIKADNISPSLPLYFNNIDSINDNYNCVRMINYNYFAFMTKIVPESYDLISTSNLTDWIPRTEIDYILRNIWITLKPNGYFIMRRLNGDYNLEKIIKNHKFNIITDLPIDRSHFYTEVVIAQKLL